MHSNRTDKENSSFYVITDLFLEKRNNFITEANYAREELILKLKNKYKDMGTTPNVFMEKIKSIFQTRHQTKIKYAEDLCLYTKPFGELYQIQKFISFLRSIKKKNASFNLKNSEFTNILNAFPENLKDEIAYFQEKINQISNEMLTLIYYMITIIKEEKLYQTISKVGYSDSFASIAYFDVIYTHPQYIKAYCKDADATKEDISSKQMDIITEKLEDYLKCYNVEDKVTELECSTLPYYLNTFDYTLFCNETARDTFENLSNEKKQIVLLIFILLTHFSNQLKIQEKNLLLEKYCQNSSDVEKMKCYKYKQQQDWYRNCFHDGFLSSSSKPPKTMSLLTNVTNNTQLHQMFENLKDIQLFYEKKSDVQKPESDNNIYKFKTHTLMQNLKAVPLELIDTLATHTTKDIVNIITESINDRLNIHINMLNSTFMDAHYQITFLDDWMKKLKQLFKDFTDCISPAVKALISKNEHPDSFINKALKTIQVRYPNDFKIEENNENNHEDLETISTMKI